MLDSKEVEMSFQCEFDKEITDLSGEDLEARRVSQLADCSAHAYKVNVHSKFREKNISL